MVSRNLDDASKPAQAARHVVKVLAFAGDGPSPRSDHGNLLSIAHGLTRLRQREPRCPVL